MSSPGFYEKLGASSQKEDVHRALAGLDRGLYPTAFCKILPDIAQDPLYCSVIHADGVGTKSILAYIQYRETNDLHWFSSLVQDCVVMNLDDVLCVGAHGEFLLSNTIGRNKLLINGDIIEVIIHAYNEYLQFLRSLGIPIFLAGGETADLGDLIRTIVLDSTLITRMLRSDVIIPDRIQDQDVIVGISSCGKSSYETLSYNSGIGSNGFTLARHALLHPDYRLKYPECSNPEVEKPATYFGSYFLQDPLPKSSITIGEALLSPTRTYAPILKDLFLHNMSDIHAIFHNTGGGQTKCLKFGENLHYVKENLFPVPPIFQLIHDSAQIPWKEMYSVFNMGHRLEVICSSTYARDHVIPICNKYSIDAKVIGFIEKRKKDHKKMNTLTIHISEGDLRY